MINIDGAIRDSILSDCPYYTSYQIPAGTYPGQDEPVETITVKATIVVSESLDEDTVYDMTAAIFDHADERLLLRMQKERSFLWKTLLPV